MKCPLFAIGDNRVQLGEETELCECMQAGCAWFDEDKNCCSVKVIARELTNLQLKNGGGTKWKS